jgi:hypothetical protein
MRKLLQLGVTLFAVMLLTALGASAAFANTEQEAESKQSIKFATVATSGDSVAVGEALAESGAAVAVSSFEQDVDIEQEAEGTEQEAEATQKVEGVCAAVSGDTAAVGDGGFAEAFSGVAVAVCETDQEADIEQEAED